LLTLTDQLSLKNAVAAQEGEEATLIGIEKDGKCAFAAMQVLADAAADGKCDIAVSKKQTEKARARCLAQAKIAAAANPDEFENRFEGADFNRYCKTMLKTPITTEQWPMGRGEGATCSRTQKPAPNLDSKSG
jgi:hypothetical protein